MEKRELVAAEIDVHDLATHRLSELPQSSNCSIRPEAGRSNESQHTHRSRSGSYSITPTAAATEQIDTLAFAAAAATRHTFASTYPARTVQAPPLTASSCETLVRTFDSSDQVSECANIHTLSIVQCNSTHFVQSNLQLCSGRKLTVL
jgi:hypothetical protein